MSDPLHPHGANPEHLREPGWAVYGPSRRSLLKGAAALATPLALGGLARAQEQGATAEQPADLPTLKIGLIGCGGRGTGAAWQALHAEDGSVVLWAMGDAFEDRLEGSRSYLETALAEEGHAARMDVAPERRFVGFEAFKQVIDSGVDVVLLTSVPAFRPAHLTYAVERGVHVFCEKPMAVDVPGIHQVRAACEVARTKGLSLVSGFCWRYNAMHRATFERIHAGAIGDVQAMYTNYYTGVLGNRNREEGWSDTEWQLRNWHHFSWLSGDHIVEQAIHSIDKQSWAFGDEPPERAIAIGGCQTRSGPQKGNTFDHFGVVYEYSGGRRAFMLARQWPNSYGENNDFLYGSAGRATIENWTPYHEIVGPGNWRWEYEGEGNDMYQQEHDELFASIRAGTPMNDGDWMTTSNLLAIMGREAAYSGRAITWDELLASTKRLGPPGMESGVIEWGDLAAGDDPEAGKYEFA
ncbi:Gfo/Idh/MocA family protein [Engelhardtia mirabilis]|uniref:4,5-dihydroxyphthalate dehydrogenase n=1 Tax=Engelhardtia mirabilis TaxID=2528011 RepID=A0A518BLL9_9BACT|nr:Putative 4,5-dihydroxyphthalate dehydrogenase [Planctomycetes bacterium Pla133]QDV02191.1 Putative 4,5-dihydroxyphthalate dehydrogenase [Planctomycetes bacterium Pla86]